MYMLYLCDKVWDCVIHKYLSRVMCNYTTLSTYIDSNFNYLLHLIILMNNGSDQVFIMPT